MMNELPSTTRRWPWLAAGALVVALLLGGAVWFGLRPGGVLAGLLSNKKPDEPAPLPPALARKARLFIRPGDAEGEFTDFVPPLRSGQRVRLQVDMPRGYELALYLWSPARGLELLAERGEDDSEPLRYPTELGKLAAIDGPPGTEILFVCGSKDGPISEEVVAKLLTAPQPWPVLPEETVLRVLGAEVEHVGGADGTEAEAQIVRHLEQIGARMQGRFDYFEGLVFCHAAADRR